MIDNLSIVVSLLAVGYVVFRAIILDKLLPWFGRGPVKPVAPGQPR